MQLHSCPCTSEPDDSRWIAFPLANYNVQVPSGMVHKSVNANNNNNHGIFVKRASTLTRPLSQQQQQFNGLNIYTFQRTLKCPFGKTCWNGACQHRMVVACALLDWRWPPLAASVLGHIIIGPRAMTTNFQLHHRGPVCPHCSARLQSIEF